MRGLHLRFLGREECHLCEAAWPLVEATAAAFGATVETVDVDADERLIGLYGLRIPIVLAPDDTVIAEGVIEERTLRKAMKSLARARG